MKTWSGYVDPCFLDLGTIVWKWDHFQAPVVLPPRNSPRYPSDRKMGRIDGWGDMLKAVRSRARFRMRSLQFFNLSNPSNHIMTLGFTQPLRETSIRNPSGGKKRPARKADSLNPTSEPKITNSAALARERSILNDRRSTAKFVPSFALRSQRSGSPTTIISFHFSFFFEAVSIVLTRLNGPRSRPTTQKIW
jgi:hypothetical protein